MRISDWSSDVCYSDLVLMFRLPVLAAVAATVVSVATPVIAQAQEIPAPTVMVIDTNRIMTEAKAMKNIRDQIERIRGAFQNEIKKEEDELRAADQDIDRKSVGEGKSVSVRVALGGGRIIKKKNNADTE